jgi:ubiquinone biosynthesis protein
VPRLFLESCCTRRMLIMEYVQGISISETERLKSEGYDLCLIARRGAEIGLRSALEFGFFHADPHPGNLIIMPGNVFGLLDYGMMGSLSKSYRERLGRMVYNIVNDDEKRTARSLIGLMESREAVDASALETEVSKIIQQYVHIPLRDIHLGNVLFQLIHILREHHLRFPTHLIWLSKAITTVEDVAHRLDPDFDMLSYARPFVRRFVLKNLNPVRQVQEAFLTTLDSLDLLRDLPYDASVIMDQLKKGRVKIEFEHIGLEPFKRTLTDITNQLAITIILAAVLISSALVIVAGVPPKIGEIPVMGIAGFILAGLLLISLILSMIFRR